MNNHDRWAGIKEKWFDEGIMDDENREKFEQAGAMEYQERVRDYYLILREKDKEKNKDKDKKKEKRITKMNRKDELIR